MNIEIYNEGNSLKIVCDGAVSYIAKQRILELSVIDGSIIKLDTGEGQLNNLFFAHAEVTVPASESVEELRDALNSMLNSGGMQGFATEENQRLELERLANMQKAIEELNNRVNTINNKTMYQPIVEDNTTANTVYKGFSNPGANQSEAVWAILKISNQKGLVSYKWADGDMHFDNIWNERTKLNYI
ncbi:MAG TPA: hypothetical protein DDX39_12120 [Bacteroidales bacterium]|nr:MAG: hypothetical protein A2W98_11525 [Bacteroidetes bacterium GWF2_33_38]OFY74865.1 MAG: hypothetical protein A2265_04100 [Bacteroidetes bacterium RIFOXYA12_FULL_33_9]OFY92071.1 MAG: hypothetical protein A2236_08935 [Bacteroidetes bacterium RIFOXYA2_FULL_33_7]HBF89378.1 hypothetical protein [Bacteroidales bacterium]